MIVQLLNVGICSHCLIFREPYTRNDSEFDLITPQSSCIELVIKGIIYLFLCTVLRHSFGRCFVGS